MKHQIEHLDRTCREQGSKLESITQELEVTSQQRKELAEYKLHMESKTKDDERKIEILEKDLASYKSNLENTMEETKELRELKVENSRELTELRLKKEHLDKEVVDKQRLIDNQQSQIEELKKERKNLQKL
jgi:chromosome segregation ATPase